MSVRPTAGALAVMVLVTPGAYGRELVRGPDRRPAQPRAEVPAATANTDRLEELVRKVYAAYETRVGRSGHELRFRLGDFKTVFRHEFAAHEWLDLLPPDTGLQLAQEVTYFDAPWSRVGKVAHYELHWQPVSDARRENAALEARVLEGASIATALALDRTLWERETDPLAITSVLVELEFAGRTRTYRAAAFWNRFGGGTDDSFEMRVNDPVVPQVATAVLEEVLPVTEEELQELRLESPPGRSRGRVDGRSLLGGGSCEQNVKPYLNVVVRLPDTQGHLSGGHLAELRMATDCHYSSECQVQCVPKVDYNYCDENGDIELPVFCEHNPHKDSSVSSASAVDRAVSCGAALACGIKECCGFQILCGGVDLTFSGSGGSFGASASNSGGGTTYNLSVNDSFECPAPTTIEPCSSPLSSAPARATAALLNPCDGGTDDGGGGPGGTETRDPGSPILLDLDRGGFRLTSLAGGVRFDIDGDGQLERLSWTADDSGDPFLALDRNGNGRIDDGRELFGNFTPQPTSGAPNGFLALAVFDTITAGGNGDGRIGHADQIHGQLVLWWDRNRDGVSQASEISDLTAAGVESIALDYTEARRRDEHGNELRYSSLVRLHRATTVAVDVFFLVD